MPNYLVVKKGNEFKVRRDRSLQSPFLSFSNGVFRVQAKTKERAVDMVIKMIAIQKHIEAEKKGSTISESSKVQTITLHNDKLPEVEAQV